MLRPGLLTGLTVPPPRFGGTRLALFTIESGDLNDSNVQHICTLNRSQVGTKGEFSAGQALFSAITSVWFDGALYG